MFARLAVVVLSLDSVGAATKVTLTQGQFTTRERLELHRHGWADSFEKLDAVLRSTATQSTSPPRPVNTIEPDR